MAPLTSRLTRVCQPPAQPGEKVDRQALILEAVLSLLSRDGIAGVSMRAVAREAGVALGLVHYYFDDKTSLIAASLRRGEEQALAIVEPDPMLPPDQVLRAALLRDVRPAEQGADTGMAGRTPPSPEATAGA